MATAEPQWRPTTLGGFLAWAREQAHLSQQALADHCAVSRALVSKWETDDRAPAYEQIEKWAEATDAAWLVPLLKDVGMLVQRWEVESTSARYSHSHLTPLPSAYDGRSRNKPRARLLALVKGDDLGE